MSSPSAETLHVREHVLGLLQAEGFSAVLNECRPEDGWRAEFLDKQTKTLPLWGHKPDASPYLSLGTSIRTSRPEDLATLLALTDLTSDFELSFWFTSGGRSELLQLSSRVFLCAVFGDGFHFALQNLLAARRAVTELGFESGF